MQAPGQSVIGRPSFFDRNAPRWRSGAKRISWSFGIDATIFSALDEVTMMSESDFTAAEQLMYVSETAPGCSARQARKASGGAGVLERAAGLVIRQYDFPCRIRILAVSAMNRTPANAMIFASLACARRARSSESPTKSARSWIASSW